MELLIIGRVYDKYSVYSYASQDNVDVIEKWTKIGFPKKLMPLEE